MMIKSNEIRIGPITRARAKLLEQQVNLFLIESDVLLREDFILPKSSYICVIRYQGVIQEEEKEQGQVARREELHEDEAKGGIAEGADDRIASRTVRDTKPDVRTSSRTVRIMPPKISGITGQVGPSGLHVGPSDLSPDRPSIKPDRPTYDAKHQ